MRESAKLLGSRLAVQYVLLITCRYSVVKRKRLEQQISSTANPYPFLRSNIRALRPRNLTVINDRLCVSHAEKILLGRPGDGEAASVGVMKGACEIDS